MSEPVTALMRLQKKSNLMGALVLTQAVRKLSLVQITLRGTSGNIIRQRRKTNSRLLARWDPHNPLTQANYSHLPRTCFNVL